MQQGGMCCRGWGLLAKCNPCPKLLLVWVEKKEEKAWLKALPPASSHRGVEKLISIAVLVFQEIYGRGAPSFGSHLLETAAA